MTHDQGRESGLFSGRGRRTKAVAAAMGILMMVGLGFLMASLTGGTHTSSGGGNRELALAGGGDVTVCATATAPGTTITEHVINDGTTPLGTIPAVTVPGAAATNCVTSTVPTVTETTTVTAPTTTTASTTTSNSTTVTTATTSTTTTPTGDIYSKPAPRYGVSPGYTILNRTAAMQDWELAQIKTVGAQLVRLDYWEEAKADATITRARAHGLEAEIAMGDTLHFAGRDTLSDFQARCTRAATKYHGVIRYYETMNEPNINGWTPAAFVPYQKACYQAIKAVDQRNIVLLAGISPAPNGTNSQGATYSPASWVQGLYANGGKGTFDLMNVHLYGDPAVTATWSVWQQTFGPNVTPNIASVMAANGDSKPVVATEAGYRCQSLDCEAYMGQVVGAALRDQRVKQVYVYDMLNTVAGFGMMVLDSSGSVIAPDGSRWRRRPSFGAFQAVTGGSG